MAACSISDRRTATIRGAGAFALALLFVCVVAWLQRQGMLDWLNLRLMLLAGDVRDGGVGRHVTPAMRIASAVGGTGGRLVLLGLALLALVAGRQGRRAAWLAGTVAGGTLLNLALKQIFAAPRPDLLPHLDMVTTYSFPSGHAAGNMMFFGALAMLGGRRWGYASAAMAIALIGISRVWLGVHWPSDVLAGWVEGLGWLALCALWLPARGGQEQRVDEAVVGRHAVGGDEAVDPEAVIGRGGGDQEQ